MRLMQSEVMRLMQSEVMRLLREHFDAVEALWDRDPYDEVKAVAVTIKAFMNDHAIGDVDEGVRHFVAFKREQSQSLARVGLGASDAGHAGIAPSFGAPPRTAWRSPEPA